MYDVNLCFGKKVRAGSLKIFEVLFLLCLVSALNTGEPLELPTCIPPSSRVGVPQQGEPVVATCALKGFTSLLPQCIFLLLLCPQPCAFLMSCACTKMGSLSWLGSVCSSALEAFRNVFQQLLMEVKAVAILLDSGACHRYGTCSIAVIPSHQGCRDANEGARFQAA